LVGRYHGSCRRVYAAEDVVLLPRQQAVVPARATLSSLRWKPPVAAIESQKLRSGIYIGRTLVPSQHDKAKVCIVNTSQIPQLLAKGTCLGNLQVSDVVKVAGAEDNTVETKSVIPKLMGRLPDELNLKQRTSVRNLLQRYEDILSRNEFKNVDAMLKHGIIEHAASPWASSVVIVFK